MIKTILSALLIYLATSIDEIPVLYMLYNKSTNRGKGKIITVAYYIGTFTLVSLGFLGALGLKLIPITWAIGFIGLIPLIMGIKIFIKGDDDDEDKALDVAQRHKWLLVQVFIITLALGADDLGVMIPLFTTLNFWNSITMLIVFVIGTAMLCRISYQLTRIEPLTRFIEKKERFIIGCIFVVIGIMVMIECGTFSYIVSTF